MHLKKTIEQHLNELSEPVRTLALQNMWWEDKDTLCFTPIKALRQAFNWSKSPQGYHYWFHVETSLILHSEELQEIMETVKKRFQAGVQ